MQVHMYVRIYVCIYMYCGCT